MVHPFWAWDYRSVRSDPPVSPVILCQPQPSRCRQSQLTARHLTSRLFLAPSLAPSSRCQSTETRDLSSLIPAQFASPHSAANLASTRRTDQLRLGVFVTLHGLILAWRSSVRTSRQKALRRPDTPICVIYLKVSIQARISCWPSVNAPLRLSRPHTVVRHDSDSVSLITCAISSSSALLFAPVPVHSNN